jgi:hypothetical protein
MRNKRMLFSALGVAGVLGVTGSAFTATSGWDNSEDAHAEFGAVAQTINGYDILSLDYDFNPSNDETEGVVVAVDDTGGTFDASDIMRVAVNPAPDPPVDESDFTVSCGSPVVAASVATYTCDFPGTGVANVTSVYFLIGT